MNKKIKSFRKGKCCLPHMSMPVKRLIRQEGGSATIEASIVFPLLMLCTCMFIFLGMLIFMKVLTVHTAAHTAERSAVVWSNSHKDPATGEYERGNYDPLYWRSFQDGLLNQLFHGLGANDQNEVKIQLPAEQQAFNDHLSLPERKLFSGASFIQPPLRGEISFHNIAVERMLTVQIRHPAHSTGLERMTGVSIPVQGEAVTAIVEPAEFIRTVEMVRYMTVKLRSISSLGADSNSAGQVLMEKNQP